MYRFAGASEHEQIIFDVARPGYSHQQLKRWLEFMQCQDIKRVCCLLTDHQLRRYGNLIGIYRQKFGDRQVCWAPIKDFQLADLSTLQTILLFLSEADRHQEKTVVHCSGGVGRTGQVLAAWLVHQRGFSNQAAIAAVKKMGRNPYEAAIISFLKGRSPWVVIAEFGVLLDKCRLI